MVDKREIEKILDEIDSLYHTSTVNSEKLYFSKLALIELCGWIEFAQDDILRECIIKKLKQKENKKFAEETIVDKTYGFDYHSCFRPMLIKTIGLIELEKIESKLKAELHSIKSQLGTLWDLRGKAAHTSISTSTHTFNAPSVIKGYLNNLHPLLIKFENEIKKI